MDFSKFEQTFTKLYGKENLATQYKRFETLVENYKKRYSSNGEKIRLFTSPGRTEIGGNHTDHNLGKVLAGSIQLDCIGAVEETENTITIYDLTYNEDYSIDINKTERIPEEKVLSLWFVELFKVLKTQDTKLVVLTLVLQVM